MGKFEALTKFLKLAPQYADDGAKLLSKVDNPELATKLVGEPRADYLKLLDESYGNQAKRAADMGFGPETYYHGTASNFDSFNKDLLGNNTGAKSAKKGIFFTDDPERAADYAEQGYNHSAKGDWKKTAESTLSEIENDYRKNVFDKFPAKKYELDSDNFQSRIGQTQMSVEDEDLYFDLINRHHANTKQLQKEYSKALAYADVGAASDGGAVVYPTKLKLGTSLTNENMGSYADNPYSDFVNQAIVEGKDSAIMKNAIDGGPRPATNAIVFEPNQIRSTNAAFDPRFKESGLIMAGAAAIPKADMSPIPYLKQAANAYNKVKKAVYEPLANQLDLTKDKSAKDDIQSMLSTFADPVNLVPGIAGAALGGLTMFGDSEDRETKAKVLTNLQNSMDERILGDLKQRKQRGW